MRDLPLNARSYEQFAFLQPNVYYQRNETGVTNTGFAPKISAGGMRTAYNLYLEDGIDIADTTGQTPGSAAGQLMGVETLREFRVVTNNYPAEYGNAMGVVVEVASRGGGNQVHGSLFEFLRNDKFDARSFFDQAKPAYRRNQFGGTVGGPIKKDRAFFFASYEAMRQPTGYHGDGVFSNRSSSPGNFAGCQRPDEECHYTSQSGRKEVSRSASNCSATPWIGDRELPVSVQG